MVSILYSSIKLTSSHASRHIPDFVEDFMKSIYKFFKNSVKRIAKFDAVVEGMNPEIKKLIKPIKMRWLTLQLAVERLLSLYNPLLKYFIEFREKEKIEAMNNKGKVFFLKPVFFPKTCFFS